MNKCSIFFASLAFLTAGAIADETYTASSVTASQTLPNQGKNNYEAKNLLDENEKTIWAAAFEGSPITLTFKTGGVTIAAIYVTNGYHKDQKSLVNNSQAKDVNVYINGKKVKSVTLTKVTELSSGGEIIDLGKEYSGVNEFALEITSVYAGKKWMDLCIADVGYYGNPEGSEFAETAPSVSDAGGVLKDSRDGQAYKTVKIGNQVWMAENLNYKTSDSWCYDNKDGNCKKYGRLYTWEAAKMACPSGWHLPTYDEWQTLFKAVGGSSAAGKALKSGSGWSGNGNGTDTYGFSALPAGYRTGSGSFFSAGGYADFWFASQYDSSDAYHVGLYGSYEFAHMGNGSKYNGYSVRCLQD